MELKTIQEMIEDESIKNEIEFFIMYGMTVVAQFHIYHLLTNNGQEHESLKEFYESVQDEIDSFAESTIANYEIGSGESFDVVMYMTYDRMIIEDEISAFRSICTGMIAKFESPETKSIQEELIELQEACDKLTYKLGLE